MLHVHEVVQLMTCKVMLFHDKLIPGCKGARKDNSGKRISGQNFSLGCSQQRILGKLLQHFTNSRPLSRARQLARAVIWKSTTSMSIELPLTCLMCYGPRPMRTGAPNSDENEA